MLNNRFAKEYSGKPLKRAGGFIPTNKSHGSIGENERLPPRDSPPRGPPQSYWQQQQQQPPPPQYPPMYHTQYESYSDMPPLEQPPPTPRRTVMERPVSPDPEPVQMEETRVTRPPPLRRVDNDTPKRTAIVTPCFRSTSVSDVEDIRLDQYAYLSMIDSRDKHKESPLTIRSLMNPIPGSGGDVVQDSEEARKRIFAWLDASDHVVIYSDLAMTPFMSEVVLWGNRNNRAIEFRFLGDEWIRWRTAKPKESPKENPKETAEEVIVPPEIPMEDKEVQTVEQEEDAGDEVASDETLPVFASPKKKKKKGLNA